MANKIKTSKAAEETINEISEFLNLKNGYFLIARLAIAATISLKKKPPEENFSTDIAGKEFNEYTLFQGDNYDYYVVIKGLLSDLYDKPLTDRELKGNDGLIKKHIDFGSTILEDIFNSTKPNRYKFLKKLYSLGFDQDLIDKYEQKEISPDNGEELSNLPDTSDPEVRRFVSETINKIDGFLENLGYEVTEIAHTLSSSILRIKIKFPPLDKSIDELRRRKDDLKLHLALNDDLMISVEGGFVCIDIPRDKREFVYLKNIINRIQYNSPVTFPVGLDVEGEVVSLDLSDSSTPHLLVGGATGQGKSEFLKSMICSFSLRNDPSDLELYLVDPKKVEFTKFKSSPIVKKILTEEKETINLLEQLNVEMERRYKLLQDYEVNNIDSYNKISNETKPHIVVIFDEFADFIVNEKEIKEALEMNIKKLAGKARAAGIHLILATQRPDASIVTGIIKANLPAKIAFKTTNSVNSGVIIDSPDAKDLLGKGDLILVKESNNIRIQGAYVPENEMSEMLNKF
jgi:hypothetical protein